MTDDEIRKIVSETIDELLTVDIEPSDDDDFNYLCMSAKLKTHYHNKPDEDIIRALNEIKNDPYYHIIPEFYDAGHLIQHIAIDRKCDRATIVRNKKRLVLELYELYITYKS